MHLQNTDLQHPMEKRIVVIICHYIRHHHLLGEDLIQLRISYQKIRVRSLRKRGGLVTAQVARNIAMIHHPIQDIPLPILK